VSSSISLERTPRRFLNATLSLVCASGAIYFFYLHLKPLMLAFATVSVLTMVLGVVAKFMKPFGAILFPKLATYLDWACTTPLLVATVFILGLLMVTTASITVRLTDAAKVAKVTIIAPGWDEHPAVLFVDSDEKQASRRFWFHLRASDITITPVGDLAHGAHTARSVRPGTAVAIRIPQGLPLRERHVVCLLPVSGLRLPFPNDTSRSPFSALLVVQGRQYRIENWKLSALFFGDDSAVLENAAAEANGAIARAGAAYFDNCASDTSEQDRQEYLGIWSSNRRTLPTTPLSTGETVYVEIDKDRLPILRQLLVVSRDTLEPLFVENVNETQIVSQSGTRRN
jgi:hypothetical protein